MFRDREASRVSGASPSWMNWCSNSSHGLPRWTVTCPWKAGCRSAPGPVWRPNSRRIQRSGPLSTSSIRSTTGCSSGPSSRCSLKRLFRGSGKGLPFTVKSARERGCPSGIANERTPCSWFGAAGGARLGSTPKASVWDRLPGRSTCMWARAQRTLPSGHRPRGRVWQGRFESPSRTQRWWGSGRAPSRNGMETVTGSAARSNRDSLGK